MTIELIGLSITSVFALAVAFLLYKKSAAKSSLEEKLFGKENDLQKVRTELNILKEQYKNIIDIDLAFSARQIDLANLQKNYNDLSSEFNKQKELLNSEFVAKRSIYEKLLQEISSLEESLEIISYGLYKPHYDYQTTEDYKTKIDEIRDRQKLVIKNEMATFCSQKWTIDGDEAKGRKMVKDKSKLMLRAFNGECDASIAKVSWNNIVNMEARIKKSFDAINVLGSTNKISITDEYLKLKLEELYLEFELEEKKNREKEEQRLLREQMRDEEKAQKELERVQKEAQEEEDRYRKALDKARLEAEKAKGQEVDLLNIKIKELEDKLQKAHEVKERAISQAQLTKSGYVYIISNIGSFGDDVFKIGMTRRLEPLDRIYELGDASVPFDFDVHGLIYSDNAPELENALHKKFDSKRLNLVNYRAEFFKISLDEIDVVVREMGLKVQITKISEAKEYRETLSIRQTANLERMGIANVSEGTLRKKNDTFPISID